MAAQQSSRHPKGDNAVSLEAKFSDLDLLAYKYVQSQVRREDTKNFVVEFGHLTAKIAFDLAGAEMETLLNKEVEQDTVRWINMWTPKGQSDVIRGIGKRYGFSNRLQAILLMDDTKLDRKPLAGASPQMGGGKVSSDDLESGRDPTVPDDTFEASLNQDLAIYKLVKDTMNYHSTDQGDDFVCIGANWLHNRAQEENGPSKLLQRKHWSWLTLCSNHTVISIHDAPDLEHENDKALRSKELNNIRLNTASVLFQLSKQGREEFKNNVMSLKSVRGLMNPDTSGRIGPLQRTESGVEAGSHNTAQSEGASNLFYYLFEDYTGAVSVLKASKVTIKELSERVLDSGHRRSKTTTTEIVKDLHAMSKELRQLQNLFESYKMVIRRILRSRGNSNTAEAPAGPIWLSGNVKLSQSARHRFERLEDRLQLLMLNTIRECLEEQAALSKTYFNITTQKDSQATARLTRSATLLAKLSVLFLPISFMTSYFGVEIPNMVSTYTPKTYWVAFAVISALSFMALFVFGRFLEYCSDKADEWSERFMEIFTW